MTAVREEAIAQILKARLSHDQRTWDQTIEVLVVEGEVSLVGTVDCDCQRTAAESIVMGVCGIPPVTDKLRVRRTKHAI